MDLEQRVKLLEDEVASLKQQVSMLQPQASHSSNRVLFANNANKSLQSNMQNNVSSGDTSAQPTHKRVYAAAGPAQTPFVPASTSNATPIQSKAKKQTDFESFVGKNVFVIVASLLIFIGVVVFASVLLPYLPQEAKFILMCMASAGFAGFSYWFIRRKQNNFTVALLACSLGTVYITLFTGNLYFKLIDTILLYIALLLWAMIIYYCSSYKSIVFNIIGQAGILLSLILCMTDAVFKGDKFFVLYALIYVVAAEILYDLLFKDECYLVNIISMLLSVSILSYPILHKFEEDLSNSFLPFSIHKMTVSDMFTMFNGKTILFCILTCLFMYAIIKNIVLFKTGHTSSTIYGIINIVGLFVCLTSVGQFEWTVLSGIIMLTYCLIIFVITEVLYFDKDRDVCITILSAVLLTFGIILYYSIIEKPWVSGLLLVLPVLWYVFYSKTTCSRIVVYVGLGIATFANIVYSNDSMSRFIVSNIDLIEDFDYSSDYNRIAVLSMPNVIYYASCLLLAGISYILIAKKVVTDKAIQILCYLFVVANVFIVFCSMSSYRTYRFDEPFGEYTTEILILLRLLIAVAIQIAFWYVRFFDRKTDMFSQGTYIAYFAVNAVFMLYAMGSLYKLDEAYFYYLFGVIITIVLFTLNSVVLLHKQNTGLSVYVGIKMTVLIFVVMHVFELAPLVSVLLFMWAVACIIAGLKLSQKPLRVYALILALISAVKLVLVDISYQNILSRAFSFIICGILCFVISYIYHRIEKSNMAIDNTND